jgi:hypothetical protein
MEVVFLVVSLFTGKWGFFLWSLPPSFISGMTGFSLLKMQIEIPTINNNRVYQNAVKKAFFFMLTF